MNTEHDDYMEEQIRSIEKEIAKRHLELERMKKEFAASKPEPKPEKEPIYIDESQESGEEHFDADYYIVKGDGKGLELVYFTDAGILSMDYSDEEYNEVSLGIRLSQSNKRHLILLLLQDFGIHPWD